MFRSTSLRLAALYTAGFALAVAVLGFITVLSARAALTQQFDTRLSADQVSVVRTRIDSDLPPITPRVVETP